MLRRTWIFLMWLSIFSSAAIAQTGTIQGLLVDAQGAAIPNAKVIATDEQKQLVVRETTTGTDGQFALRSLLPGTYTVKSEVTGFKGMERTGLILDQNQIMDLG